MYTEVLFYDQEEINFLIDLPGFDSKLKKHILEKNPQGMIMVIDCLDSKNAKTEAENVFRSNKDFRSGRLEFQEYSFGQTIFFCFSK